MKKSLFLLCVMAFTISMFAQNQHLKLTSVSKTELRKSDNFEPKGNPAKVVVRPVRAETKGTKNISTTIMGQSSNPYTLLMPKSACLSVNTDLNLISFTARTNEFSPVFGNNVASYFSTNGGWGFNQSLMRPWTSPNGYNARYPSGVIYNPVGNNNPANAFIAVAGPSLDSTWNGAFFASQKFDGTTRNEQYTLYTTDTAGGVGFLNKFPRMFMQCRNNKVFVLGDANEDNGSYYTSVNAILNIGEFQGDTISWTRKSVSPNFANTWGGSLAAYSEAALAMDNNGTTGYMVFSGANLNSTDQMTYQPIVYKTIDGGNTWNDLGFIWNCIPAIQNLASVLSPVNRPHFKDILDITIQCKGL